MRIFDLGAVDFKIERFDWGKDERVLGFKVFEGFKVVEKGVVVVAIEFVFCLGVCWLTSYARVKALAVIYAIQKINEPLED